MQADSELKDRPNVWSIVMTRSHWAFSRLKVTVENPASVMTTPLPWFAVLSLALLISRGAAQPKNGDSPADHLPPHIVRLTAFGERPDWAADGTKKIGRAHV